MILRYGMFCSALAALLATVVLAACSEDENARPDVEADGGTPPGPPDAGSIPDDGAAPDARGPFDPNDEPVTCASAPCVTQLVAGSRHFCARLNDETVRCWGDHSRGQLGRALDDGADAGATIEAEVTSITQLSAAGETTCSVDGSGTVSCWGGNTHGELGRAIDPPADEDPHPHPEPVALAGGVAREVARVDVGHGSVCAMTSGGSVLCWGNDESAQLARGGPTGPAAAPAPAELVAGVKRTSAGIDTGFALTVGGSLLTWGAIAGAKGVLSGRTASIEITPAAFPVDGLASVSSFAVSGPTASLDPPGWSPGMPLPPPNQHACAVSNGDLYCWGKSERGAFGIGLPDTFVPLPMYAPLASQAYAQQVAAGGKNTCVRLTDGSVMCAGANDRGQLGSSDHGAFSSKLVKLGTLGGRAVHVAVANETACALLQGGTVECWGGNSHGELGTGGSDDDAHPSATKVRF